MFRPVCWILACRGWIYESDKIRKHCSWNSCIFSEQSQCIKSSNLNPVIVRISQLVDLRLGPCHWRWRLTLSSLQVELSPRGHLNICKRGEAPPAPLKACSVSELGQQHKDKHTLHVTCSLSVSPITTCLCFWMWWHFFSYEFCIFVSIVNIFVVYVHWKWLSELCCTRSLTLLLWALRTFLFIFKKVIFATLHLLHI